jgi:hypothetical protein
MERQLILAGPEEELHIKIVPHKLFPILVLVEIHF